MCCKGGSLKDNVTMNLVSDCPTTPRRHWKESSFISITQGEKGEL